MKKNKDSMYTEEDFKLADKLLNVIRREHSIKDYDLYCELRRICHREGDDAFFKKCRSIWLGLQSEGLVGYENSILTLTKKGRDAASHPKGLENYWKDIKEDYNKTKKARDFELLKWKITCAGLSIVLLLVVLHLLGILPETSLLVKAVKFLFSVF